MPRLAQCVPRRGVGTLTPAPSPGEAGWVAWGNTGEKQNPFAGAPLLVGDKAAPNKSLRVAQPGLVIFPWMSNAVFLEPDDNIFPWQRRSPGCAKTNFHRLSFAVSPLVWVEPGAGVASFPLPAEGTPQRAVFCSPQNQPACWDLCQVSHPSLSGHARSSHEANASPQGSEGAPTPPSSLRRSQRQGLRARDTWEVGAQPHAWRKGWGGEVKPTAAGSGVGWRSCFAQW